MRKTKMKLNKIGWNWIAKVALVGALFGQLSAFGIDVVSTELKTLFSALDTVSVADGEALLSKSLAGDAASAKYIAGFKILHKSIHGSKSITLAQFRDFANQNHLTLNATLGGVTELVTAKKPVTLANLQGTASIVSYTKALSANQAQTAVVGLPTQLPAATTGGAVSPVQAMAFYQGYRPVTPEFAQHHAKTKGCTTAACTIEQQQVGTVLAAAKTACNGLEKTVPDCTTLAIQSSENWAAGTYSGMLAGGDDAQSGTDWTAVSLYGQKLGTDPAGIMKGWRVITAESLQNPIEYYNAHPELNKCVRGRGDQNADANAVGAGAEG